MNFVHKQLEAKDGTDNHLKDGTQNDTQLKVKKKNLNIQARKVSVIFVGAAVHGDDVTLNMHHVLTT